MKKIFSLIFLIFIAKIAFSQDFSQTVSYKLLEFSQNNIVEKAYLHCDKPYYLAGENIWFKAYLVEGIKNKADSVSGVLYVDLVHNKTGNIIKSDIYHLVGGLGDGTLSIPDTAKAGVYTLRAYTNWMRNFDESFYFKQDLEIINLEKKDLQNDRKIDFDVAFFPESGNLIDDIQTKIAFKATEKNGKSIEINGILVNQKGDTISRIATEKFGMGMFRLRPKLSDSYFLHVNYEGKNKKFELPKTLEFGFVLNLDNLTSVESVGINIKSKLPSEQLDQPMLVVAQSKGNSVFTGRFKTSNQKTILAIPRAMLPDGIVQFTIFDEKGTPFSERIIYNNSPKLLNISAKTEKDKNSPRGETSILIEVQDLDGKPINANLSMAVTDGTQVVSPEYLQDIRSYLSLSSDIKGKIESPSYYFDRKNIDAPKHLDYLMMTQGWRRFTWKNVLTDAKINHVFLPETALSISGKVRKYNKKALENSVQINGSYNSSDTRNLILSETDKNGNFFINNLIFSDTANVFLQASTGSKDKIYDISLNNPDFEKNKPQTFLYKSLFNDENKKYIESANEVIKIENNEKMLELAEVNVKAKKEKKADFRRPYGDKVTKTVDYKDYSPPAGTNVLESIQSKVPGVTVKCFGAECSVRIRGNSSLQGNNEAVLMLDGTPVDAASIQSIPITEVERIDVISGAAATLYGSRGATGLINVLTKRNNPNFNETNSTVEGIYKFRKVGFSPVKEFYAPKYEENTSSTIDDSRTTIYWSPNIEVKDGKAKVTFYNSAEKTNVNVDIQGKNENGALGVTRFTYKVE